MAYANLPGCPPPGTPHIVVNVHCESVDELHNNNRLSFLYALCKATDTILYSGVACGPMFGQLPEDEIDARIMIDMCQERGILIDIVA